MDKKPQIVIQQMYEDTPNTVFSTSAQPHRTLKSHSGMETKSHSKKGTCSTRPPTASKSSSLIFSKDGSSSKSSTPVRVSKKGSDPTKTNPTDKMSPKTAIALYGDKLTPFEHREILQYSAAYHLGLGANKRGFNVSETKTDAIYDDQEHFYKVVPKDHIVYRYEVAEKPCLGKGTFGQVIKAYDHKEKKNVALKLVRNDRIYLKQSREELRILQVLRKQDPHGIFNVVQMHEFFMFRNHMVISFELLGMNLYQLLKKNGYRGLISSKIQPIATAVLKCLELLYRNRIIHCDIKPENIMLRRNGDTSSVKVGDFGSSCYEQQQVYHYIQSRYYRAPEVMLGMRYGPPIDMWSFGCVLGELCTGYPLFVGTDEDDQLAAIAEVLGAIPKSVLEKSKQQSKGLTRKNGRGAPGSKSLVDVLEGDDLFKDLVKKTLQWDSSVRPSPLELRDHPWLSNRRASTAHVTPTSDCAAASSAIKRSS